jgi:hypothetical protein
VAVAGGACAGGNFGQVYPVILCCPGGSDFEFPLPGHRSFHCPHPGFVKFMSNVCTSSVECARFLFENMKSTCLVFLPM